MQNVGTYLYGFTERDFDPGPQLRGLAGAPVRVVALGEVAAVVSQHPVRRLRPSRANLEPHHRIVQHVSSTAALVPAAFGHISESESDVLAVLRGNYDAIRAELARLGNRVEMGLKLRWNVPNLFAFLVHRHRDLREARDRVFRGGREPSMADKLEVGALFEATLAHERERLGAALLASLETLTQDVVTTPPRDELTICTAALLVERPREAEFVSRIRAAAALFDASYTIEYSGPWPAYNFVRLRLEPASPVAEA